MNPLTLHRHDRFATNLDTKKSSALRRRRARKEGLLYGSIRMSSWKGGRLVARLFARLVAIGRSLEEWGRERVPTEKRH